LSGGLARGPPGAPHFTSSHRSPNGRGTGACPNLPELRHDLG